MANNYKIYGLTKIDDDQFLTIVGSLGSVSNGCSRAFWGIMMDRFGFRKLFFIITAIQVSISFDSQALMQNLSVDCHLCLY